jgi:hypothetical protein
MRSEVSVLREMVLRMLEKEERELGVRYVGGGE